MALIGSAAVWKTAVMGTLNTTDLNAGEIATLEAFWLGRVRPRVWMPI